MSWFFIALIGPALWAASNHIDKYLLHKNSAEIGFRALTILSGLFSFGVLPFIVLLHPNVFDIRLLPLLLSLGEGVLSIFALILYFLALRKSETSMVIPLFQVGFIYTLILGYFLLGETLSVFQILASLLIILGAIILSFELSETSVRFKTKVFLLMLGASFLFSVGAPIFKLVAEETNYATSLFWEQFGIGVGGMMFLCIKSFRKEFLKVITTQKTLFLSLNGFNEAITVLGNMAWRFASLLAPVALVYALDGFQPLFVFIYGIIITIFFPKFGQESLLRRHMIQKISAIVIMMIGTYLLNLS